MYNLGSAFMAECSKMGDSLGLVGVKGMYVQFERGIGPYRALN